MQAELRAANPGTRICLLAVNDAGYEAGNGPTSEGRTIPLLQDTPEAGVWAAWAVEYRDVVVLDAEGRALGRTNLTGHDLEIPENYEALLAFLRFAAGE
jgi:hypothetical protein